MRKILLGCFLLVYTLHSDELSLCPSDITQPIVPERKYSLQLFSTKSLETALKKLKQLPEKYASGTGLYQFGNYYAARYINITDRHSLPGIIAEFKKLGYRDTITFAYNPSRKPFTFPTNTPIQKESKSDLSTSLKLSQHDYTKLILDAQKAIDNHNIQQATILFEMLLASGVKERQLILNLAYLYGKEGSIISLERLIKNHQGLNDFYYAYGIGALENNHANLYSDLSPQLIYDKSGRLNLLCGYFFERQNNLPKAAVFYKMAYEASPNDPHILYAFARFADLQQDYSTAIPLYTQLARLEGDLLPLATYSRQRIQTIRDYK